MLLADKSKRYDPCSCVCRLCARQSTYVLIHTSILPLSVFLDSIVRVYASDMKISSQGMSKNVTTVLSIMLSLYRSIK
jgi:hypothetical protein